MSKEIKINQELLFSIVVPDFITQIKTAEARRPIYYEFNGKFEVSRAKMKFLGKKYEWKLHKIGSKVKNLFTDIKTGLPVLKNPRTAGTTKYMQINGNHFYAGFDSYHTRVMIVNAIKENFRKHFTGKKVTEFPIRLEWIIYDELVTKKVKGKIISQDGDNKFYPFTKSGQDLMKQMGILPDDNLLYIRKSSWEFIDSKTEKKLIINAYPYKIKNV